MLLVSAIMGPYGTCGHHKYGLAGGLFHAVVGGIFTYLGFLQRDTEVVREAVGGMGLLLLLIKGVTILSPLLWGGPLLRRPIEITCLMAGHPKHLGRQILAGWSTNGRELGALNLTLASPILGARDGVGKMVEHTFVVSVRHLIKGYE
ncbi:MAG: hypothetical protein JOZ19_10100 [Rubrobacter sp.]|nr:hypothetical protein [Rubrobacter sp.]